MINKRGLSERVLQWHHTSLTSHVADQYEIKVITYIINHIGLSPKIYTGSSHLCLTDLYSVTLFKMSSTSFIWFYNFFVSWKLLLHFLNNWYPWYHLMIFSQISSLLQFWYLVLNFKILSLFLPFCPYFLNPIWAPMLCMAVLV